MVNLENNDVCPIVASVLKIFQVFPVSFFGAELHTDLKMVKKPFCGEGKKNIPKKHIYVWNSQTGQLAIIIDKSLGNHLNQKS